LQYLYAKFLSVLVSFENAGVLNKIRIAMNNKFITINLYNDAIFKNNLLILKTI